MMSLMTAMVWVSQTGLPNAAHSPASAGLDSFSQWVIGGLVTAVVALSGYIVKLHTQIARIQKERVQYMEGQLALIRELKDEINRQRGGRP